MKINQAYVGVKFFKAAFLSKFKLREYHTTTEPAIFFGMYHKQRRILQAHRGMAVIVWAGSDAIQLLRYEKYKHYIKHRRNTYHIAISSFIANDLRSANIPFIQHPVIPHSNHDIPVEPLGDSVYVYTSPTRPNFYGMDLVKEVQQRMPNLKFLIADCHLHTREHLIKNIYSKCFIGLRLIDHDGLSNTVIELGLMGRRVIWNGNTPNAIPYVGVADIVNKIKKEQLRNSDLNSDIAKKVQDYITLTDSWLHTNFYKDV